MLAVIDWFWFVVAAGVVPCAGWGGRGYQVQVPSSGTTPKNIVCATPSNSLLRIVSSNSLLRIVSFG